MSQMTFQFHLEKYVSIRTSFNLKDKKDWGRSRSIFWSSVLFQSPHFHIVDIKISIWEEKNRITLTFPKSIFPTLLFLLGMKSVLHSASRVIQWKQGSACSSPVQNDFSSNSEEKPDLYSDLHGFIHLPQLITFTSLTSRPGTSLPFCSLSFSYLSLLALLQTCQPLFASGSLF